MPVIKVITSFSFSLTAIINPIYNPLNIKNQLNIHLQLKIFNYLNLTLWISGSETKKVKDPETFLFNFKILMNGNTFINLIRFILNISLHNYS